MILLPVLSFLLLAAAGRYHAMIQYEVEPAQAEYLLQQEISLKIRITNSGAAPVQVPDPSRAVNSQPVFALAGPGYAPPQTFSNWSVANPGAPAPPITDMTVAPGETWEGELALSTVMPIREPGEFRVGSMLAWQGGQIRSQDRTFRVSRPDAASVHLGMGKRPFEKGQGGIVFLQREGSSAGVYSGRFDETDPSNSEVQISSIVRRAGVSGSAADIASPWRNSPFFDELLQWIVWREGRSLKALNDAATVPVSFDLPSEPAYLVRPPLKVTGGPVEVLAVSGDRRSLLMVSIPAQLKPKPVLAWQSDLPAAPHSMAAALGPKETGSVRHIALVAQRDRGFEIFHTRYQASGKPEPFQSMRVETGTLHANAPITMLVTGDGVAHIAVLAGAGDEKSYTLVEAQFGDGEPAKPAVSAIGPLEKEPTAAAVLYTDRAGSIVRRDVVLAVDGKVLKLENSGRLSPLRGDARPVTPLLLTPGESESYVLCFSPERGFYFRTSVNEPGWNGP